MRQPLERPAAADAVAADTFRTLLVHVQPGAVSTHRVEAAASLARDFGAVLIGLGAETHDPNPMAGPYMGCAAGEWVGLQQAQIDKDLKAAESAFRRDAAGVDSEWRTLQDDPDRAVLRMAHAADLIVVAPRQGSDRLHAADPAEVAMSAGRPVLMAPPDRRCLSGKTVVVGWKDTPQCRRAVADALPFLRRAEEVIVHAVRQDEDSKEPALAQAEDVVANLRRHGVRARALVTLAPPEGVTLELERVASLNEADLIVCGAYGRGRMREWALGGVTDDLMHRPPCFVLMSH